MAKARLLAAAALWLAATRPGGAMAFMLSSPAFEQGKPIPKQYSCEGRDVSPPLRWSDAPANTKALALVCDDPDAPAGTWVHWVIYDIPAATSELRRSEERRVGKECRARWSPSHVRKSSNKHAHVI